MSMAGDRTRPDDVGERMRYLLLIYDDESNSASLGEKEVARLLDDWWAYDDTVTESGVSRGGEALQPVATATTVRLRDGDVVLTDGPFAETREHLGGYYLVECESLDQAIEVSRGMPHLAAGGCVEIRPVMDMQRPAG
jgi:hypothetical protein